MLSTGSMGAERANIPISGTVAVFAKGPVGLMATVGRACLARVSDRRRHRAEAAGAQQHLGTHVVVDFARQNRSEATLAFTDGQLAASLAASPIVPRAYGVQSQAHLPEGG
jgi:isopropanol dehydrogenase (NADP+)